MQEGAADQAADRIQRKKGIAELQHDRHGHRDSEDKCHLVAPPHHTLRVQQLYERQRRAEHVECDQQTIHHMAQRTGHIHPLGVDGEEDAGEAVHGQPRGDQRQQPVPAPLQAFPQPAVQFEIDDQIACPGINGQRYHQKENRRVCEDQSRKIESRKYPPQNIRQEKKRQADQKAAAFLRTRKRDGIPPAGQMVPVDDQIDDQRDGGYGRIQTVVLHKIPQNMTTFLRMLRTIPCVWENANPLRISFPRNFRRRNRSVSLGKQ